MLISKNFIDRLNQYMRENNMSQKEFSDLVGCSKGYVSQLLSAKKVPSTHFIEQLAKATNTQPQFWIHSDTDDNFNSLSVLVDMLIEKGLINDDSTVTPRAREMIDAMLFAEIKKRVDKIKEKKETD